MLVGRAPRTDGLQVWTQEDEDDLRAFEAEQADKETATTCPMMGTFVKSKLKMH